MYFQSLPVSFFKLSQEQVFFCAYRATVTIEKMDIDLGRFHADHGDDENKQAHSDERGVTSQPLFLLSAARISHIYIVT